MAAYFDIAKARRDGYSSSDILDGLNANGSLKKWDIASARKDGYSDDDILDGLIPEFTQPAPDPVAESGILRRAGDYGISALKSAIAVPELAVGMADIVTGGHAGKLAEQAGFRPREAKAILDEYLSPEQQAANKAVSDAKGFIPTIGAALQNPSTIAHTVTESIAPMLTGGIFAQGIKKLAPKVDGYIAGAFGEGIVGAGMAAEQVRQQTDDGLLGLKQVGAVVASGTGTALFGALGGKLAQKFNIGDIDTMIANGATRELAVGEVKKGMIRRIIEGGISEGVFEELPQSMQEQVWQNVALGKPVMEGVPESGAMGLLAGGLMGGGANLVFGGGRDRIDAPAPAIPNPLDPNISSDEFADITSDILDAELAAALNPTNPPPPPPANQGGFSQINELADFAAQKRNELNVQRSGLINAQQTRRMDSALESTDARVAGAQEAQSRAARLQLLDEAYSGNERAPGMTFLARLSEQFPNNPLPTPEEKAMIAKRDSSYQAYTSPGAIPSLSNETDFGIKEAVQPVVAQKKPVSRIPLLQKMAAQKGSRVVADGIRNKDGKLFKFRDGEADLLKSASAQPAVVTAILPAEQAAPPTSPPTPLVQASAPKGDILKPETPDGTNNLPLENGQVPAGIPEIGGNIQQAGDGDTILRSGYGLPVTPAATEGAIPAAPVPGDGQNPPVAVAGGKAVAQLLQMNQIAAKAEPSNTDLADALEKYEGTGELATVEDLANEVESLIDDGKAPGSLQSAIDNHRQEQADDHALAGRGDMEQADEAFVAAVRAAIKPAAEAKPVEAAKVEEAKAEQPTIEVKPETVAKPNTKPAESLRAVEKDAFAALAAMQQVVSMASADNNAEQFRLGVESELGKWVVAEMDKSQDADRTEALNSISKDGLPQSFYDGLQKEIQQSIKQKKHEDLVVAGKSAMTLASSLSGNKEAFEQGWNHALAGKTISTLPGDEAHSNGYKAARLWLLTADGRAAYTGKRTKKLENTGADLRRWFDQQKAKITEGDTDFILSAIENSTTRAELFRNVLAQDSTPGAQQWLERVRNQILPFKRWVTEKGSLRNFDTWVSRGTSDTEKIRQYLDGKLGLLRKKDELGQAREDRIKTMRDAADEYVTLVALLTDKLDGSNVESLAKSLDSAVFKEDVKLPATLYADSASYSEEGKQIQGLMIDAWKVMRFYGWNAQSYYLADLIKNENTTTESTRKAPLTPPRLDRVGRDGDDLRKGKNVTPQEFKRKFNFADVGFGKWVGAKQDQDHLNYSYDAFYDLANMLNLPPEAISLGGRLHFTIGALGHGKFAAHYQPQQPHPDGGTVPVINVTNTKGDGTVAHEWSHALDLTPQDHGDLMNKMHLPLNKAIAEIKKELSYGYNYDRLRASVISMLKGDTFWSNDKRAKHTEEGRLQNARSSIEYYASSDRNQSKYLIEALKLDGSNKKDPYWSNHKEIFARAFEAWIGDAMDTSNTYLVNPAWSGDTAVTGKSHRGTPYPTGEERERFNKWFDALSKSLKYDGKNLTLDEAAWTEHKPKTTAEWKQALDNLRDEIPSMMEAIKRETAIKTQQSADEKAHAASMRVGDRVKAREGRESQFRERFGDAGAIISEIRAATLYFEDYDRAAYSHNVEVVQRKADIQAQAQAADVAETKIEPAGELSETDLSALFDEAAAELQESTQEQPEVPPPGEAVLGLEDDFKSKWDAFSYGERQSIAESSAIGGQRRVVHRISGSKWVDLSPGEQGMMRFTSDAQNEADKQALLGSGRSGKLSDKGEKTAAKLAAAAAKQGVTGIDEALKGLTKLFGGGPGRLSSFPGGLDEATYKEAKPHFVAALKAFQEAGKTIKELFKFLIENFGHGVKPYAIHFAKEMNLTAGLGQQPTASRKVAAYIQEKLNSNTKVSWQELFDESDKAWGGTQAAGTYTVKDAYDAMELGVNLYIRSKGIKSDTNAALAAMRVTHLTKLIDNLPTQTKRTAETDEFQQFSTPPALSYVASWVANIKPTDTLLEPSAGTGDLAIYADNAGAKLILNELSSRRAELLRELYPHARIFTENAEQLNNVLPADAVPTVVVMNPPFSSTAGRLAGSRDSANGAKHIEQALKRLPKNGRLVAISGSLPAAWVKKIKQTYNVRAMIDVSGKEYAKYGTTFDNQIIVIDNDGKTVDAVLTGRVESVSELPKLLEGIRNDKPIVSQSDAAKHESNQALEKSRLDAESEDAVGSSPTDAVGAGSEPAGTGAGVGGDPELQRPIPELGGVDNQSGKNKSQAADAVLDGDGQPGQIPNRPGRVGTGRSGGGTADGTDSVGTGAAGETSGLTLGEAGKQEYEELTGKIFENYKPQRLDIPGAKPHPGNLVQSSAMASVEPPAATYTPNLPKEVINKGLLSLAQLEAIVYAGQAHQQFLPNGERRGYFIGDGTGVGKGREIAGIILDNMRQGQKKAIWVSYNEGLIEDAQRDFSGIGGDKTQIFWQGKTKAANPILAKQGILFTAYSTLKGGEKKQANDTGHKQGKTRLDQIIDWVGEDYDGVIVFDEAHSMGNIIAVKGKRGNKKPAQQAIAGANLQKRLPKARIVYVSATGATEVSNLGYAARLGLWGEGTSFTDVRGFIENVTTGGVASMELISRDMKALGMYISRSLSFDGVTYQRLEHELTPLQNDIYNELAKAWQTVLQNVDAALKLTDGAKNGNAKGAALAAFWGAHQRFFNQVITSLQTPTVIADMKQQIADGNAVVIQLTNTNEATQEREAAKAAAEGTDLEEMDFTPRQMLMDYVRNSFPVQAYQETQDNQGNTVYTPVMDAAGNPVFDKEAIALREALLTTLEHIRVPENPIDAVIAAFGSEKVGEVTGRKRRFIQQRDENGNLKVVEEKRGKHAAHNDATDFQNDKKPILIFSQAGGTGYSFHADNTAKNQRKRIHYILQPGWRADAAVQGFGRTHRTNQKQEPHYVLPTTNLKAQKRFVSSIARRLDQLGALTRGERQATSQGLFSASDNLESKYAADALDALFNDMYRDATSLDFHEITGAMGLSLIDVKTGALNVTKLPEMPQFLNRLLSLQSHQQDAVFAEFEKRLDEAVDFAVQNGTYDNGMQTLKADSIKVVRDEVAHIDERTGAKTRYVEVDVTNPVKYRQWSNARHWADDQKAKFAGWFKNENGEVFGMSDMGERVDADGKTVNRGAIIDIRDGRTRYIDNVKEIQQGWKWVSKAFAASTKKTIATEVSDADAQKTWEAEVKAAPKTETTREHMIVGVILPIWDRVKGHPRIVRLQTDTGERMIGRIMGSKDAKITLKNLGLGSSVTKMSPEQMLGQIHGGAKAILANGWDIAKSKVSGEGRIEISKPSGAFILSEQKLLTEQGAFTERIQWVERAFIPTGDNELAVFERITKSKPVVDLIGGKNKDTGLAFEQDKEQYGKDETDSQNQTTPDVYETNRVRVGTTEKQKRVGREAFDRILGHYADRDDIAVLGSRIAKDFQSQGATQLIGQTANTHEDLAVIAQVLRDPRFETFRVFFTKAGKIVGHTGITSRLAGSVTIVAKGKVFADMAAEITLQKENLNADGYWLLHNHPSGRALQSAADMTLTETFARQVRGFLGHVIIDHDEYTNIGRTLIPTLYTKDLPKYFNKDVVEIPHNALNADMLNAREVANVGKMIQRKHGFITLIGRGASGKVSAIAEIPASLLDAAGIKKLRLIIALRRFASQTGSTDIAAVAERKYFSQLQPMVEKGLLMDVVASDEYTSRGGTVSMRDTVTPYGYGLAGDNQKSIRVDQAAFHGSPYTHDKFDMSKVGTGEGAQAYGYGLYFAGNKKVAEYYRNNLSTTTRAHTSYKGKKLTDTYINELRNNGTEAEKAAFSFMPNSKIKSIGAIKFFTELKASAEQQSKYYQGRVEQISKDDAAGIKVIRTYDKNHHIASAESKKNQAAIYGEIISEFKREEARNNGKLYSVELAPAEDEYLLWDKPLSEQSEKVKAALKAASVTKKYNANMSDFSTPQGTRGIAKRGNNIYTFLSHNHGGDKAASEYLHSIGIRGIKYLDGSSRSKGEGQFNYVIFNDVDVTITSVEQSSAPYGNPTLAAAMGMADNFTGKSVGAYGIFKNVNTQLHKARNDPEHFGKVFSLAMDFKTTLSRSAYRSWEQAKGILPAYGDVGSAAKALLGGKKNSKELSRVSSWVFKGTTYGGGNPLSGIKFTPKQLRDSFQATDHEIELYEQAHDAIGTSLTEVANAIAWKLAKPHIGAGIKEQVINNPDDAQDNIIGSLGITRNEENAVTVDAAIKSIKSIYAQVDKLKAAGYAPLSRFGKYTVDVFKVDENGDIVRDAKGVAERLDFRKYDYEAEARAAERKLKQEYKDQPDVIIKRGIQSEAQLFAGVDPDTVALFVEQVGDIPGLDIKREVLDEWRREAVSQRSAITRNIKRKGVAGYSEDLPRVLATFLTSNARYASSNFHMGDMLDAINKIPDTKGDVKTEAKQLYDYINANNEPGAWMRGIMFAWYLGGSPAAALVNLAQPVMMTLPYLTQFGNPVSHLLSSVRQARNPKLAPEKYRALLRRGMEEGLVDAQEVHHLYAESMSSIINNLPGGQDLRARAQGAATIWGAMFGMAENFNRRITFLSAVKMAEEMGAAKLKSQGFADPYEFAKRAVEETQGIYSKENRPNWARGTGSFGAVGVMAFTFKQFSIQYVELLVRMYKSGPKGKASAGLMIGLLILASGLQGFPGADDMEDLWDTIAQSLGFKGNAKKSMHDYFTSRVGERMADIAMYGLSAETPLDVQTRLGLGNLFPATAIFKPSETNKAGQLAEILGAPGGLVKSGGGFIEALQEGSRGDAFAALSPVFIRNVAKSISMLESGVYKDTAGRKLAETSTADAVIKAIGFQPQSVAEKSRKAQMARQDISRVKGVESNIAEIWAYGMAEKDQDEVARARKMLADWNEDNPETPIRINKQQLVKRVRDLRAERAGRLLKTAPREMKQYVRDTLN